MTFLPFNPFSSLCEGHARCSGVVLLFLSLLIAYCGCSREDGAVVKIRETFADGNVQETIALCKRALRDGTDNGEVHLYYGLALLGLDRDHQAFTEFESAVAIDPSLSGRASGALIEAGRSDFEAQNIQRAARRFKQGANINPSVALGRFAYLVADAYYYEKAYMNALVFYERALSTFPDTVAAEEAYLKSAEASIHLGAEDDAETYLRSLMARDPWGPAGKEAKWKLAQLLSDRAKRSCRLGNFEEVIEVVREVFQLTDNEALVQNCRFVLGEAYEGLGDYDMALEQYRSIIHSNQGASTNLIEKAKEKIEDFRRAGFLK